MEKNTKILIGVGLGIFAVYFVKRNRRDFLFIWKYNIVPLLPKSKNQISCEKEYDKRYGRYLNLPMDYARPAINFPSKEEYIEECIATKQQK